MKKKEIENKKTKIEIFCSCAYSQLLEADDLICELVNNGNLEKYELNKFIILFYN